MPERANFFLSVEPHYSVLLYIARGLTSGACRYVAAKTDFFRARIRLPDLENRLGVLQNWCRNFGATHGYDMDAPASGVNRWYGYSFGGPGQENPTTLNQCTAEQKWMRESMLRSLLYLQVPSPAPSDMTVLP